MNARYIRQTPIVLVVLLLTSTHASDSVQQARELVDRFRAIDWDARAVMVRPPALAGDEQWKTRIVTEFELVKLGPEIVPFLTGLLQYDNRHVRALAAYVLGVVGDPRATAPLVRSLSGDSDPTVRVYMSDALGRLASKEALPAVEQQATNDASSFVKFSARVATQRITADRGANGLRDLFLKLYDKSRIASAVVGSPAPDFALTATGTDTVRLSDFQGKKNVVLLFQLADW